MTTQKAPNDFNDLHVLRGLPVVREQLQAALFMHTPKLPTPLEVAVGEPKSEAQSEKPTNKNQPFSDEILLERFALIEGKSDVWDTRQHIVMKKGAFKDLVGKKLSNEWLDNPNKKTISLVNVKSIQENSAANQVGVAGVDLMLSRYILIYGTKDVWDSQIRTRIPVSSLEIAWPNEYQLWLKNSSRRRMVLPDKIVFDPTMRTEDDCINTFDGLPLIPLPQDQVNDKCLGIYQLLQSMCEDDFVFNWVLRWLALPLQKMGTKLATAILFHGEVQGAGKSLFFSDIHRQVYGKYSATLGQHQLESQYSDWKSGNLYSVFEEIFSSSGRFQNMGVVKHEVTGKTRRVEKKFVSGWEEANYSNCVFLSNEIQPLPIEPRDRRFLVCWPNFKLDPDILAYAVLDMNRPDNEGIRAWYTFLLNLPMEFEYQVEDEKGALKTHKYVFTANSEPPMTKAKERLIEYGLPAWEVFLREWKAGRLQYPYTNCRTRQLYEAYKRFCGSGTEKPLTETKFCTLLSVRLHKELTWFWDGQARKQAHFFIVRDIPQSKTKEAFLAECSQEFATSLKNNAD